MNLLNKVVVLNHISLIIKLMNHSKEIWMKNYLKKLLNPLKCHKYNKQQQSQLKLNQKKVLYNHYYSYKEI